MISYPTRSERRELNLIQTAEKGDFSLDNLIVYPGEIRKLKKDGFVIHTVKPFDQSKSLYTVTVDWSNAYSGAIPHIVHSYIHGIIETYPKNYVKTFAQELFIITHLAILHK